MNNTQPPRLTLTSRVKRSVTAGLISALVYLTLTGAAFLLAPSARDESATYEIRMWIFLLIVMLSLPGFVFAGKGGDFFLLAVALNLVIWFSLGTISAYIFRKNGFAIAIWIVLAGIVAVLVGWVVASGIFRNLAV